MRTQDEARGYSRGYSAGSHGRWPDLGTIPEPCYQELATAATELSEAVDGFLATFDDRDEEPEQVAIDDARERVRLAVVAAQSWCSRPGGQSERGETE